MRQRTRNRWNRYLATYLAVALVFQPLSAGMALAGPVDYQVEAGNVSVVQNGDMWNIVASDGSILDSFSFDILPQEIVNIVQPSEAARMLNKIRSEVPTQILGTLMANGSVYFVNPAGVYFGDGAVIDVHQLVTAAGNITNEDFLAGNDHFTNVNGVVENSGTITADLVALIGRHVANHGVINADGGMVTLLAGDDIYLQSPGGKGFVKISTASLMEEGVGVENTGTIDAGDGAVSMAAGDFYAMAIRHDGTTIARDISIEGGTDGRVEIAGVLDASDTTAGATGGNIEVLGDHVRVFDADIDASGDAGGGQVLIGGAYQGQGPTRTAKTTFVSDEAQVRADAVSEGDGGEVVVWADGMTGFAGKISARGGAAGGDGGSVEVSGKEALAYSGLVDTSAPNGNIGTLLLDPQNATIDNAGTATLADVDMFSDGGGTSNVTINATTINAGTSTVFVRVNDDITVAPTGTINMANSGVGLSFQAGRSILVNADITTMDGNVTMVANNPNADPAVRTQNTDAVLTMADGTTINAGTADIDLSIGTGAGANPDSGAMTIENLVTTGTVTLTNTGGTGASAKDIVNEATGAAGSINAGTLNMTAANGAINYANPVIVTGATTLSAAAASNITLTNAANNFGTVSVSQGQNVALTDTDALNLGASSVTGNLDVTTGGALTDSGAVMVGGVTTLSAGTNAITLDTAGNDFNTVSIAQAGSATLVDTDDLDLGASSVTGNLDVTTGGALTDSGAVMVGGLTTLNVGSANNATLDNASNDFSTVQILAANDVVLRDASAIDLGASTVSNDLTVTSGGGAGDDITDSGPLSVAGAATFNGGAMGDVTLDDLGNTFGSLSLAGMNIALADPDSIDLAAATISGTLSVTSGGAASHSITQSGPLSVAGSTTLAAGSGTVTLDNASNDFSTVAVLSAGTATLVDSNGLDLGASSITGNFDVTAGGPLSDSGPIVVGGTTTLATGTNSITLDNPSNDFSTATVVINNAGSVTIVDMNAIGLGASTVSGSLDVTSGGNVGDNITQTGPLSVAGATSLSAGAANVTLTNASNNFSTVSIVSGNNVSLTDANAINLGMSSVTSQLAVTSGGNNDITQSGQLLVGGSTGLSAGTGNITLADTTNDFMNAVIVTNANSVALADANNLTLGALFSTGSDLDIDAGGIVDFTGLTTVGGNLDVDTTVAGAGGANITESTGQLTVTGTTTLNAGTAGNVVLTTPGNNFASTLSITNANSATISDAASVAPNTLSIGTVNTQSNFTVNTAGNVDFTGVATVGGALNVDTNANGGSGGNITDTGANGRVLVTGTTTLDAGTASNITLDAASNDFMQSVAVTNANNVLLNDDNAIILTASSISGTLGVTSGGGVAEGISQVGAGGILVAGSTTLVAGSGTVNLGVPNNDFSTVAITTAGNALLLDANSINLGTSNVTNLLQVGTGGGAGGGTITQTGVLTVGGNTLLIAGTSGDITLANPANNFSSVQIISAGNVDLADTNGLNFNSASVTGTLDVTTGGAVTDSGNVVVGGLTQLAAGTNNITLDSAGNNFSTVAVLSAGTTTLVDTNALDLATSSVSGALNVTTGGALTDSGTLTVAGPTSLQAGAANDITLDTAANNFTTVSIVSGNNVDLVDANALDLGASNVSGTLDVTTGGNLTDSGGVVVAGLTRLMPGGANNITLDNAANDFSTVMVVSANNVVLTDAGALDLAANSITGTFDVTTGGPLTDSGTQTVGGLTRLQAGAANDITLDQAANDFSTVAILSGNNVDLVDANALDLGASNVSGTLDVTTGGNLTDSGNVVVGGLTQLAAGTNNITLNSSGNDFSTVALTSAGNAVLLDANSIDLGASSVMNLLQVGTGGGAGGGNITQSGTLTVGGNTLLIAGSAGDITLADTANDFSSVQIISAGNVDLADTNALNLNGASVTGSLDVTTGGPLTDSGNVLVGGLTQLMAGAANDITLDSAGNNFSTVSILSGNNVDLVDANALDLGASNVSGTLDVTTGGNLTDSGGVVVTGLTRLMPGGANNITLDNAANNFSTVMVVSANNVVLTDAGALDLAANSITGTFDVTTGGPLTDSGTQTVGGLTRLQAGAANDITLDQAANDFSTVAVLSGNNVDLVDASALDLGGSNVSGSLDVTTGGPLTDSGGVVVAGLTQLMSGAANDITLDNAANNFSTVSILSGNNVDLTDSNALDLGASMVTGTLDVTTGGPLTDSGTVVVGGLTQLQSGAANDITLDSAANNFSTVAILSGNNVDLVDTNALDLGASNVTGSLDVTTGGPLTDSGNVAVGGLTRVMAGAANDITLDQAGNNFSTVSILSGNNVTLVDANQLDLGASAVSGNLAVTSGTLTDSGPVTVGGTTNLNAPGSDIALDDPGNDFMNTVFINAANNVTLRDANALDFGTSNVTGALNVTGGGAAGNDITQTGGVLTVGGTTTVNAGSGHVTFNNPANDFASFSVVSADAVTLADGNNLIVLGIAGGTNGGDVDVDAMGGMDIRGMVASAGGSVSLDAVGVLSFQAPAVVTAGNDVSIQTAATSGTTAPRSDAMGNQLAQVYVVDPAAGGFVPASLTLMAGGNVNTGHNALTPGALPVKFSIPGNLSITAGGTANVGDLTAMTITINATTIDIQERTSQPDGSTGMLDGGTNIVGNTINLTGNVLALAGPVVFATPDGGSVNNVPQGGNVINRQIFNDGSSLQATDFPVNDPTALNGLNVAIRSFNGSGPVNNPRLSQLPILIEEILIGTSLLSQLNEAAKEDKPLWGSEIVDYLECATTPDPEQADCEDFDAAALSADERYMVEALQAAGRIAKELSTDPQVADALQDAFTRYLDSPGGANPTGAGFRAFVTADNTSRPALGYLNRFRDLADELSKVAEDTNVVDSQASRDEIQTWFNDLVFELAPVGMSEGQMLEAIGSGTTVWPFRSRFAKADLDAVPWLP